MNVGVVSSLPAAGTAPSGVSYYAADLSEALAHSGLEVIVLANQDASSRSRAAQIDRVWKHGVAYPFSIARAVLSKKIRNVLVEHTPFLYGTSPASTFSFPFLLAFLRILGCRVTTDLHDVRPLRTIDSRLVKSLGLPVPPALLRFAFTLLFGSIARLSHRVIVHDPAARETVVHDYGADTSRVTTIALLPPAVTLRDRAAARRDLSVAADKRCLLFFGYASAYKGLDLLGEALETLEGRDGLTNLLVLIAAGPNPHLAENDTYRTYYEALKRKLCGSPFVRWCGFIDDDEVGSYFAAADAVILPYTGTIGSSYPLAQAVAYGCPALVSTRIPADGYDAEIRAFEPNAAAIARVVDSFVRTVQQSERERFSRKSADAIVARYRAALSA